MKILIEVKTPGNGKAYEFMIDDRLTVGAAKEKIVEEIQSFENNCISFDCGASLFSPATRAMLKDNRNLKKTGIRGGHTVFLL